MRIVGGHARGRTLKTPKDRSIRPTSDRVRESIFNLLGSEASGSRVLDLFAGTGALGIEALSRGAESALFVDEARQAIVLIGENLDRCGFREQAQVERRQVQSFLSKPWSGPAFDLVLMDPPYKKGLLEIALTKLGNASWVVAGGSVICEAEIDLEMPSTFGCLQLDRTKLYGDTAVFEYVFVEE